VLVRHLFLEELLAGDELAEGRRSPTADQRACEAAFNDGADSHSARSGKGCSLKEHGEFNGWICSCCSGGSIEVEFRSRA
jgi:hypothetical protein